LSYKKKKIEMSDKSFKEVLKILMASLGGEFGELLHVISKLNLL